MHRINQVLQQICGGLNAGDAENYCLSAALFTVSANRGTSLSDLVVTAHGETVSLHAPSQSSAQAVLREVAKCLSYEGDESSHPDLRYLRSASFANAMDELTTLLSGLLTEATEITKFAVDAGSPFYPRCGGFAFGMRAGDEACFLLGSCSD